MVEQGRLPGFRYLHRRLGLDAAVSPDVAEHDPSFGEDPAHEQAPVAVLGALLAAQHGDAPARAEAQQPLDPRPEPG